LSPNVLVGQVITARNRAPAELTQQALDIIRDRRKQSNGLDLWSFEATGLRPCRLLLGYLLSTPIEALTETPLNNSCISQVQQEKFLKQAHS
jgi:hypothetical protein